MKVSYFELADIVVLIDNCWDHENFMKKEFRERESEDWRADMRVKGKEKSDKLKEGKWER